jgi:hypothetical protein
MLCLRDCAERLRIESAMQRQFRNARKTLGVKAVFADRLTGRPGNMRGILRHQCFSDPRC